MQKFHVYSCVADHVTRVYDSLLRARMCIFGPRDVSPVAAPRCHHQVTKLLVRFLAREQDYRGYICQNDRHGTNCFCRFIRTLFGCYYVPRVIKFVKIIRPSSTYATLMSENHLTKNVIFSEIL